MLFRVFDRDGHFSLDLLNLLMVITIVHFCIHASL